MENMKTQELCTQATSQVSLGSRSILNTLKEEIIAYALNVRFNQETVGWTYTEAKGWVKHQKINLW